MKQHGISLPELLISLLLASVIMTGLMHIYLVCKRQYQDYQTRLEAVLDLQWLSQLLVHSIHQAGFTPCMKLQGLKLEDKRPGKHGSIQAIKVETGPEPGLTLQYMDGQFEQLLAQPDSNQILVSATKPLSKLSPLLVSDCSHGEIHEIADIAQTRQGQRITLKAPLAFEYRQGGWAGIWVEEKWFIKKNKQTLYYQRGLAAELSSLIHTITIKRQANALEVILGLDKGKTWSVIAGLKNA